MSWGNLTYSEEQKYNELFEKYVPADGMADTLGGEILRAMSQIVYRYYNDGDTIDRYDGNYFNHNRARDNFLTTHCPAYHSLGGYTSLEFEYPLCQNLKSVLNYLSENTELFSTPNEIDSIEGAPYENDDDDDYDYDFE